MVMEKAVHPANFVPESIGIDVLFKKMKSSRNHFVVILDEYGGMSGIVTINDLVEQLVGNLYGDLESHTPYIEQLDTGTWRIDGSVPVERVSKILGISLPLDKLERNEIDEYDSFGKLIFSLLGYIPEDGETLEFEGLGMHIKIEELKRHKVEKAIVSLKPPL
jgi:putative hemolysin